MGANSFVAQEGRILSDISDSVYILDPLTYELLYVNRAACSAVGKPEEDWKGRKCYEFFRGRKEPCSFCNSSYLQEDRSHISDQEDPETHRRYVFKDRYINWQGQRARLRVGIDFSDSDNVKEALESRMEILDCLKQIFSRMADEKAFQQDYPRLFEVIRGFYEADAVHMYEVEGNQVLAYHNLNTQNGYYRQEAGEAPEMFYYQQFVGKFCGQGDVVIINDLEKVRQHSEQFYQTMLENRCWEMYTIPLRNLDQVRGYLAVINPHKHKGDLTLMQIISSQLVAELTRKRAWEQQNYQLYHDSLTGLLNRTSYLEYLERIGEPKSLGYLMADINGLKQINNDLGQSEGNEVVKQIGEMIREVFSAYPVFRFGSDDFVVICRNILEDAFLELVKRLKMRLAQHPCGACVGYAWDDFDMDINHMSAHAEELLRLKKQQLHENEQKDQYYERTTIKNKLSRMMEQGDFRIFLQPKVNMHTGAYCGAEALIRLYQQEKGLIPPGKFVPYLEKTETIQYVDFFVLEEVCRLLTRWKRQGIPLIPISLNFSRISLLEEEFAEHVDQIIRKYGAPKEMIELEITETIGEYEHSRIAKIAEQLSQRGLKLSMDDFGTKYSSLYMISQMPFHSLKLDRSLVNDLEGNAISRKVTSHVIRMCNDLNIQCISEGVETMSQAELLMNMDCDIAQGFLYSKPVPIEEFEAKRRQACCQKG